MDFLVDPETPRMAQIALRFWLLRLAISSKADVFFTMANPSSTTALPCIGSPLVGLPDRLLPHKTPLFVRACNPETKPLEADGSIHLTLGDLDYFKWQKISQFSAHLNVHEPCYKTY